MHACVRLLAAQLATSVNVFVRLGRHLRQCCPRSQRMLPLLTAQLASVALGFSFALRTTLILCLLVKADGSSSFSFRTTRVPVLSSACMCVRVCTCVCVYSKSRSKALQYRVQIQIPLDNGTNKTLCETNDARSKNCQHQIVAK